MSHPHPELSLPGALPKGGLRIIPLGGLGEVGRNMTVFEYDGRLLIVDCGVLFPEDHHPGVDLILPDFDPIRDRLDKVEALVLTHGHEDHIGATPYLLRERGDIPLVGSGLTLALLGAKLREHRLRETVHHVVKEGDRLSFGPFDLEFVAVNHSIPDALAVAIRTGAGMVLHTGDFKMDQLPLDGRITDLRAFARLGEEGVDLFMTDSTNAEVPGFTTAEKNIGPVLDGVFHQSKQRIIVACFASHIHRVQQILDAAANHGRKCAYVGRSMVRNMARGARPRLSQDPAGRARRRQGAGQPGPGTAGAHLHRVAGRAAVGAEPDRPAQPQLRAHRGGRHGHPRQLADPRQRERRLSGHQRPCPLGSQRRTQGQRPGARQRPRQRRRAALLLQHRQASQRAADPRRDPAHARQRRPGQGDRRARPSGSSSPRTASSWTWSRGLATIVGKVDCGYVFVDGSSVGDITESDLKDRRILGEEGFISVIVVMDSVTGKVSGGPEIHARGFAEDDAAFDAIKQPIIDALDRAVAEGVDDSYQLQQTIRRVIGRWVSNTHRRRPMIIPVVIEA